MFNLNSASIGIRKAAALKGIWSGQIEFFGPDLQNPLAKVFNKNNPNGVFILTIDRKEAEKYTWSEIKKQMRPWDNCEEDVTQDFKDAMAKLRSNVYD